MKFHCTTFYIHACFRGEWNSFNNDNYLLNSCDSCLPSGTNYVAIVASKAIGNTEGNKLEIRMSFWDSLYSYAGWFAGWLAEFMQSHNYSHYNYSVLKLNLAAVYAL